MIGSILVECGLHKGKKKVSKGFRLILANIRAYFFHSPCCQRLEPLLHNIRKEMSEERICSLTDTMGRETARPGPMKGAIMKLFLDPSLSLLFAVTAVHSLSLSLSTTTV